MKGLPSGRGHRLAALRSRANLQRQGPEHASRHPAQFVVVTDRLPGRMADPLGLSGLADDPVTRAVEGLTARLHGRWVGRADGPTALSRVPVHRLVLDEADTEGFEGQSRSCIWPLYHDTVAPTRFEAKWHRAYRRANAAFAAAAVLQAAPGGSVWVHDYHLQLVPAFIRTIRPDLRVGFYLESAFPAPDLFRRLPMWREIVAGLLGADHLGFQSARSAENFLQLAGSHIDVRPTVGVYPSTVDTSVLAGLAGRPDVVRASCELRRQLGSPATIILSINRVDEAQGVENRLATLESLLRAGRLPAQDTAIVQILTGDVSGTRDELDRIVQRVARINGQFGGIGRVCVHAMVTTPTIAERVALYLAADLMIATPLREAATLPALEFVVVARSDAALVLSEFSGTAEMLPDAFVVNPHDSETTAKTLAAALTVPADERARRMNLMRAYPLHYDSHAWAMNFVLSMHGNRRREKGRAVPLGQVAQWPSQPHPAASIDDDWLMSDS